jgi:ADP-ribosylglycohydrolase
MLTLPEKSWLTLAEAEGVQLLEEGRDHAGVQALLEGRRAARAYDEGLWLEGQELPLRDDWPYAEPSDWAGIVAARPGAVPSFPPAGGLEDRVLGAWLGRCAGCMLGKPVEGRTRAEIAGWLRAAGEYPLRDYFPRLSPAPEGYPTPDNPCLRGNILRGERDDDMDYPIVDLVIRQRYGPDFTPAQVGEIWMEFLPYHQTYTAEVAAYRNLVNEVPPPESAVPFNPYREWIGAQIRADFWGWTAPGEPARAAEWAWRDACISHTKNGIYGEMFFAALLAAALATDSLDTALEAALTTIPARSRFAEMVADCREWAAIGDWEQTRDRIEAAYGHYHPVHTLSNAAVVLAALLHAEADYSAAVGEAVQGGWDTDCNGATAGSVWGALHGAAALPEAWVAPLHDTLISAVFGYGQCALSELARETLRLAGNQGEGGGS